jgi:hypothetical protein
MGTNYGQLRNLLRKLEAGEPIVVVAIGTSITAGARYESGRASPSRLSVCLSVCLSPTGKLAVHHCTYWEAIRSRSLTDGPAVDSALGGHQLCSQ